MAGEVETRPDFIAPLPGEEQERCRGIGEAEVCGDNRHDAVRRKSALPRLSKSRGDLFSSDSFTLREQRKRHEEEIVSWVKAVPESAHEVCDEETAGSSRVYVPVEPKRSFFVPKLWVREESKEGVRWWVE